MTYIPGNNWAICDRCGFRVRALSLKTEWTGLKVCPPCYDPKHAQLTVKAKPERIKPEVIRSEPQDVFISSDIIITKANDVLRFIRSTAQPEITLTHATYTKTTYMAHIKALMEADANLGGGTTYTIALSDGKMKITPSSGTIGININTNGSGRAGFIQDIAEATYITAQLDL